MTVPFRLFKQGDKHAVTAEVVRKVYEAEAARLTAALEPDVAKKALMGTRTLVHQLLQEEHPVPGHVATEGLVAIGNSTDLPKTVGLLDVLAPASGQMFGHHGKVVVPPRASRFVQVRAHRRGSCGNVECGAITQIMARDESGKMAGVDSHLGLIVTNPAPDSKKTWITTPGEDVDLGVAEFKLLQEHYQRTGADQPGDLMHMHQKAHSMNLWAETDALIKAAGMGGAR